MKPLQNTGRLALVTRAAQGIGQAIALVLAERGARVIATELRLVNILAYHAKEKVGAASSESCAI